MTEVLIVLPYYNYESFNYESEYDLFPNETKVYPFTTDAEKRESYVKVLSEGGYDSYLLEVAAYPPTALKEPMVRLNATEEERANVQQRYDQAVQEHTAATALSEKFRLVVEKDYDSLTLAQLGEVLDDLFNNTGEPKRLFSKEF